MAFVPAAIGLSAFIVGYSTSSYMQNTIKTSDHEETEDTICSKQNKICVSMSDELKKNSIRIC